MDDNGYLDPLEVALKHPEKVPPNQLGGIVDDTIERVVAHFESQTSENFCKRVDELFKDQVVAARAFKTKYSTFMRWRSGGSIPGVAWVALELLEKREERLRRQRTCPEQHCVEKWGGE